MALDIVNWKAIVEALLYAAGDEGLTKKQLVTVLEIEEAELAGIMEEVAAQYKEDDRGIELTEYADTYMLGTKK